MEANKQSKFKENIISFIMFFLVAVSGGLAVSTGAYNKNNSSAFITCLTNCFGKDKEGIKVETKVEVETDVIEQEVNSAIQSVEKIRKKVSRINDATANAKKEIQEEINEEIDEHQQKLNSSLNKFDDVNKAIREELVYAGEVADSYEKSLQDAKDQALNTEINIKTEVKSSK